MYLLEDPAQLTFLDPFIIASFPLALAAVAFGLRDKSVLRTRPRRSAAYQVLRLDLGTALVAWGIAQSIIFVGWIGRLEGIRMPIWSYLGLIAGGLIIVLAAIKMRTGGWSDLARSVAPEIETDGSVRKVSSQTWEFGLLGSGAVALATYMASQGHGFSHPIHWLITGVGVIAGYGLGLTIMTPRAKVQVRAPKSAGRTHERRDPALPRSTNEARSARTGRRKR